MSGVLDNTVDDTPESNQSPEDILRLPKPRPAGSSQQAWDAWKKTPGPDTLTPLIRSVNPVIDRALHSYGMSNDPTMKNVAQLHVIKVLPRFDPSKSKLETFLTNELKRLQRIGTQQTQMIKAPERVVLDWRHVNNSELELKDRLGRDPTVDELSDFTGIGTRRISMIRRSMKPTITAESFSQGDNQQVGGVSADYEDLWRDSFYAGLGDPVDRKIMDWTLGWHDQPQLSKTEMARRLGISSAAVSQRSARLASSLEQSLGELKDVVG